MPGGRPRKGTSRKELATAKRIARQKELREQRAREDLMERLKSEKSASQLYFEQLRAQPTAEDVEVRDGDCDKMDVDLEEDSTKCKLEAEEVNDIEDEEPVPFSQLAGGSGKIVVTDKLRLRIISPPKVTKGRQVVTMGPPVPPRRPLPPSPKHCFVCRRLLSRFDANQITRQHCLFLLVDLLGVMKAQANLHLDQVGKPESWLGLCQLCHRLIIDGAKDREEIRKLKASIKKRQQMFRYKFKPELSLKVCGEENPALEKIWELIQVQAKGQSSSPDLEEDDQLLKDPLSPTEASPTITPNVFYCGLCTDDKVYSSQAELQSHTDEAHPPDPTDEGNLEETQKPVISKPEKEGLYSCPTCPDIKRYNINRIAQHLAIHRRLPYKCTVCHSFLTDDELQREQHWTDKHQHIELSPTREKFLDVKVVRGTFWRCKGCSVGFSQEALRDSHERKCTAAKAIPKPEEPLPYSCSACKKRSRSTDEWRLHRVLSHPELDRISCLYCDASFGVEGEPRNEQEMLLHIRDHHESEKPRRKRGCGSIRWSHSFFIDQVLEECEPCGLVFISGQDAPNHFREKHGEPDGRVSAFSCPICRKGFNGRISLKLHGERHHFLEESICDICGESFKGVTRLLDHKVRVHDFNPGEEHPIFFCREPSCQYKTVIRRLFERHSKDAHVPHDRFQCKYCGKGFKHSKQRSEHQLIHENKKSKPHQCEICGNSFALKNYLYIHKRLSHEGRTFPSTNKKTGPRPRKQKKNPGPEPEHSSLC